MYYTGLRHPERFSMLVARACNSDATMLEQVGVSEEARKLPIFLFWGKADLQPIQDQSWQAYAFLRTHEHYKTTKREIEGGHIRRPDLAWDRWKDVLPARYRNRR
jgi:hypothetical protein